MNSLLSIKEEIMDFTETTTTLQPLSPKLSNNKVETTNTTSLVLVSENEKAAKKEKDA
jgi:hypothetical protein